MKPVVIIGGISMDIKGKSFEPLVPKSSNPGKLSKAPGGVGRNIAHNLALLNIPVMLLGVVGGDHDGRQILQLTEASGVHTGHVLQAEGQSTGIYLALLNCDGEMDIAFSDMSVMNHLDIRYLSNKMDVIQTAGFIVCDTNIPKASIHFMIRQANALGIPICVEPVSVSKAKKLRDVLEGIDYITPNGDELEALSGVPAAGGDVEGAAGALIRAGIKNIVVTLGEKGMCLVNRQGIRFHQSFRVPVADVTGAGDALTAGFIYGLMKYGDHDAACRCGLAAAAITVSSRDTVSMEMSEESLLEMLEK